jgi:CheY-like chemotaxis protein
MRSVLIVEDSDSDTRQLFNLLKSSGVEEIEVASGTFSAMEALRKVVEDSAAKPDLLIVDLGLGMDSGYEILRYWRSTPKLATIPVIVWTSVGGKVDEEICKHFRVNSFVNKQAGPLALQRALAPILESHA